jgi:hypothetical protein
VWRGSAGWGVSGPSCGDRRRRGHGERSCVWEMQIDRSCDTPTRVLGPQAAAIASRVVAGARAVHQGEASSYFPESMGGILEQEAGQIEGGFSQMDVFIEPLRVQDFYLHRPQTPVRRNSCIVITAFFLQSRGQPQRTVRGVVPDRVGGRHLLGAHESSCLDLCAIINTTHQSTEHINQQNCSHTWSTNR